MKKKNISNFTFSRKNYFLLILGGSLIALGLLLMIGGGSSDPNVFSDEIFSSQRITFAPILIILGFVIEIFAIMHKSKQD